MNRYGKKLLGSSLWIAAGLLVAVPAALSYAQSAQAQTAQAAPAFTHPQTVGEDLARLDLALNNTGTLQGRFTQTGSDGSYAQGAISLQRPGKIRLEYDTPNPLLIVSDGVTITQTDRALGTSDRVPLSSTPIDFFLKNAISLARDTEVLALQKYQGETHVTVRDKTDASKGQMTMVFNEPNLAMKEWRVRDEFGIETRVVLSSLIYNQELDPRLFISSQADPATGGPRRRRD